jgi:hypothetical protein
VRGGAIFARMWFSSFRFVSGSLLFTRRMSYALIAYLRHEIKHGIKYKIEIEIEIEIKGKVEVEVEVEFEVESRG